MNLAHNIDGSLKLSAERVLNNINRIDFNDSHASVLLFSIHIV